MSLKTAALCLLLILVVMSGETYSLTTNANVTIRSPIGAIIVNNQPMTCVYQGNSLGGAFDSPTVCGSYTSSPGSISRSNVSCTYPFNKNYTVEGAWTANVTFYHSGVENSGVPIDTTGNPEYDTNTPPTGQRIRDCTGTANCYSDPQCNYTINESALINLYTVNWDNSREDCEGYGRTWVEQVSGGNNYPCCGDDGASDDFYYWNGTTCNYCNNGAYNNEVTKCPASSSYCSGSTSPTCHGGDNNYCCYNVDCGCDGAACNSTRVTGSETNVVGGNCTCYGGKCLSGFCDNISWSGAGCYSGVSCASGGWAYGSLDSPPKDAINPQVSPASADSDTVMTVNAVVEDYAPVTGSLQIQVYRFSDQSPGSPPLCNGNIVASGQNSFCSFKASDAGCSEGNCIVKILVYETDSDLCGGHKYSLHFANVSFSYSGIVVTEVHTDKTSYKSCGTVYYKVSTYNLDNEPIDQNLTINITDPAGNVADESIAQTSGGVYRGVYTLPPASQIGEWYIRAFSCGIFNKSFGVGLGDTVNLWKMEITQPNRVKFAPSERIPIVVRFYNQAGEGAEVFKLTVKVDTKEVGCSYTSNGMYDCSADAPSSAGEHAVHVSATYSPSSGVLSETRYFYVGG